MSYHLDAIQTSCISDNQPIGFVSAPKCNQNTLHVYNGNITCHVSNVGFSCEMTCKDNYVFFEDPSVDVLYVSCSFGEEWSREMPICTGRQPYFTWLN